MPQPDRVSGLEGIKILPWLKLLNRTPAGAYLKGKPVHIEERMKTSKCLACGKEIVFLDTHLRKKIPINAETVEEGDIKFNYKKHVAHFSDCPGADKFRKG
jgi:hypothetical protein